MVRKWGLGTRHQVEEEETRAVDLALQQQLDVCICATLGALRHNFIFRMELAHPDEAEVSNKMMFVEAL